MFYNIPIFLIIAIIIKEVAINIKIKNYPIIQYILACLNIKSKAVKVLPLPLGGEDLAETTPYISPSARNSPLLLRPVIISIMLIIHIQN
mgnify:CR=1 FL=1